MASAGKPLLTPRVLVLSILFVLTIVMGAGPGVYLVNPDPADPEAVRFFMGMPVVYVWSVGWFLVEAAVVVIAYFTIWSKEGDSES